MILNQVPQRTETSEVGWRLFLQTVLIFFLTHMARRRTTGFRYCIPDLTRRRTSGFLYSLLLLCSIFLRRSRGRHRFETKPVQRALGNLQIQPRQVIEGGPLAPRRTCNILFPILVAAAILAPKRGFYLEKALQKPPLGTLSSKTSRYNYP